MVSENPQPLNAGEPINPLEANVRRIDKNPTIEKGRKGRERLKRQFEDSQGRQTVVETMEAKEYVRPEEVIKELKLEVSVDPLGQKLEKEDLGNVLETQDADAEGGDLEESMNVADEDGTDELVFSLEGGHYPYVFIHQFSFDAFEDGEVLLLHLVIALGMNMGGDFETIGLWVFEQGEDIAYKVVNRVKGLGVESVGHAVFASKESLSSYSDTMSLVFHEGTHCLHDDLIDVVGGEFVADIKEMKGVLHVGGLMGVTLEVQDILHNNYEGYHSRRSIFRPFSDLLRKVCESTF